MTTTDYTDTDAAWNGPLAESDDAHLDVTLAHPGDEGVAPAPPTWSPGDLCRGGHCPDHGDCGCGAPLDCDEWRSGTCDGCYQYRDEMGGE